MKTINNPMKRKKKKNNHKTREREREKRRWRLMSHRYAYPIDDENVEMNEREERKWKMYAVGERQMAYPNIPPHNEMKRVSTPSEMNDGGEVEE